MEDKNFKEPPKFTWLSSKPGDTVEIDLVEYGMLLKVENPDEVENLDDAINWDSKFVTHFRAEADIAKYEKGALVQFERRCYAILDA